MPDPLRWIDAELAALDRDHLRRRPISHSAAQGPVIEVAGRSLVNFGSNDYLGLAADPRLADAMNQCLVRFGSGSGASPLVVGHSRPLADLETDLAQFEGAEAALVFVSGYAANLGAVTALAGPGDVVYSDQLNHASIIDGCRLSRAEVVVYPHVDLDTLHSRLSAGGAYRRRLIVTDSLFSMDGNLAPLAELAHLAEQHDAMLLVDEAHATGVFGAAGRGVAEHLGVNSTSLVRVGTLSKALGAGGGFVAGSRSLIEWLRNRARSYVFSTALPPAVAAAGRAALAIVAAEPYRRQRLLAQAEQVRRAVQAQGWNTALSQSQIIPLLVGPAERAMQLSAALADRGYYVPGIRPPSVPVGQSRLRLSLSAAHTDEMIAGLLVELSHLAR